MKRLLWSATLISLAIAAMGHPSVQAQTLDDGLDPDLGADPLAQITSVSELRDVQPTAWAYEALQSLVERYGCIVGYPDRTFRGNRSLSRWEFAAGLNACMNVMERLMQENVAILRDDINTLKRLMQEFEAELAALGARIDNLEARTAFLEDHQFSTTTKLGGEVVMAISGIAGGKRNNGTENIPQIPTFGYRSRLELNTSFTGADDLYIRLATGSIPDYSEVAGTFQPVLGATQPDNGDLAVEVLNYNFAVNDNVQFWLEAAGGAFDDFTDTVNVLDGDGAFGAVSAFGTRNPIYYLGEGTGIGFQGNWGDLQLSLGYLASEGNNPNPGAGLFNGAYGAIAQLAYGLLDENLTVAFTYAQGYNTLDTGTGSTRSNFRFYTEDLLGEAVNTSHNAYGAAFSWRIAEHFTLGAWGGFTNARTLTAVDTPDFTLERGDLDIWNWAVTLAFPDVIKEGNMAGIIVGMQPWVSSSSITFPDGVRGPDADSSLHIESFFEWALTDNLSITPGILIAPNANYDNRNETLIMGVVRTTFVF
ncbi:MAG: hypothetical protein RLZZ568_2384 [Cyanobacteriota bacterium]